MWIASFILCLYCTLIMLSVKAIWCVLCYSSSIENLIVYFQRGVEERNCFNAADPELRNTYPQSGQLCVILLMFGRHLMTHMLSPKHVFISPKVQNLEINESSSSPFPGCGASDISILDRWYLYLILQWPIIFPIHR